jgi:hypothetical protein
MTTHDDALRQLTAPSDDMVLDAESARVLPELDRLLRERVDDLQARQTSIDALSAGPPVMYTRGGGGISAAAGRVGSSLLDDLLGLYLPIEGVPAWLPPAQRYVHEQTWPGRVGSAAAYIRNGKLTTIQSVDTTVSTESTWAGVYATFEAEPARFGTLSRVTVEPEVHWTGRDLLDVSHVWNADIDGTIAFDYRLWTVVYERNPVSGQYEPLLSNRSAVVTTVAHSTWHIVGGGMQGHSGTLPNGAGALAFVVERGRTYLFGVVAEMRVSHSLRRTDRQPIPQPSGEQLTAYGLFKADVPAMYLSHVVLAP